MRAKACATHDFLLESAPALHRPEVLEHATRRSGQSIRTAEPPARSQGSSTPHKIGLPCSLRRRLRSAISTRLAGQRVGERKPAARRDPRHPLCPSPRSMMCARKRRPVSPGMPRRPPGGETPACRCACPQPARALPRATPTPLTWWPIRVELAAYQLKAQVNQIGVQHVDLAVVPDLAKLPRAGKLARH